MVVSCTDLVTMDSIAQLEAELESSGPMVDRVNAPFKKAQKEDAEMATATKTVAKKAPTKKAAAK